MKTHTSSSFIRGLIVVLSLMFILTLGMMVIGPYMLGGEEMETWMLIVNVLLLAIPIGLLYILIGILVVAIYRNRKQEPINLHLANWIYWSPRICCIALVAFMSLFALDVFEEGYSPGEMLVGFLMHMIPMLALASVLVIAWRWPWVGAVVFGLAALAFLFLTVAGGLPGLGTFLIIGAPLLMIALLFALNAKWRREIDSARHPVLPVG